MRSDVQVVRIAWEKSSRLWPVGRAESTEEQSRNVLSRPTAAAKWVAIEEAGRDSRR